MKYCLDTFNQIFVEAPNLEMDRQIKFKERPNCFKEYTPIYSTLISTVKL